MIINHNMSAIFAQRQLKQTQGLIDKSIQKLSSGLRITRAGDDASGLAVSEKMRTQIRGLARAQANAENAISFVQVAEGYLDETGQVLQRTRELAVQAANGIYSDADRAQIQVEVTQLVDEIDRIAKTAEFNKMKLLTGKFADGSMVFHIGANQGQNMKVAIGDMTANGLGITAQNTSISTAVAADSMLGVIDIALDKVNQQRADLGAYQNRMEKTVQGLSIAAENMQAAESRVRDADIAHEMVTYVKNQILVRSGTAMLAQANLKPQTVLDLLR